MSPLVKLLYVKHFMKLAILVCSEFVDISFFFAMALRNSALGVDSASALIFNNVVDVNSSIYR